MIVSFINMKGGVAKTTLCANVGWAFAEKNSENILVIDMDPQANATQYLLKKLDNYYEYLHDGGKTIYNIFTEQEEPASVVAKKKKKKRLKLADMLFSIPTDDGGLSLIPSCLDLMKAEGIQWPSAGLLSRFISKVKDNYDHILIDCPPTVSFFTYSAYLASDAYVIPVKPDPLSIMGLPILSVLFGKYKMTSGKTLKEIGLVFTMVRETVAMRRSMLTVKSEWGGDYVFENSLRFGTGVTEAVEKHLPLFKYPRTVREGFGEEVLKISQEMRDRMEEI
jgi:chromosome partitioning protein